MVASSCHLIMAGAVAECVDVGNVNEDKPGQGLGEGELWGRAHYYMVWELARLGALQPHSAPLLQILLDLYNVYS